MSEFVWSTFPTNKPFEDELWAAINSGPLVLDVGCGNNKVWKNVIGIDAYNEEADVKAVMWDLPFDDQSVDAIICMAALEHISKYQVMPTLAEFKRVIKPGGKMVILVPDLAWVCMAFLQNPTLDWEMDLLFGIQSYDGSNIDEGEFHRTGFTVDIFKTYLAQVMPDAIMAVHRVLAYNQINLGIIVQERSYPAWI